MHLRTPQVSRNFTVLLTLKANDHVILPDDVYGGTFRLTEQILNRFGIQFTTVNATQPEEIERAIHRIPNSST